MDFPHAAQRITQVGQALFSEGTPQSSQWIGDRLHQLKHQGPYQLLNELRQLQTQHSELTLLNENLAYLEKRVRQMNYPYFQQQGWLIGSGMVESGNKLVVEVRLKGAGMHWQRTNVNPMLGLRNIVCSDRWSTDWPLIAQQLRQEAQKRHRCLREMHRLAKSSPPLPVPAIPQQSVTVMCTEVPNQQLPKPKIESGSRKPSDNHPWRHAPVGSARFAPTKPAKN